MVGSACAITHAGIAKSPARMKKARLIVISIFVLMLHSHPTGNLKKVLA
jgi:hypothetical protein